MRVDLSDIVSALKFHGISKHLIEGIIHTIVDVEIDDRITTTSFKIRDRAERDKVAALTEEKHESD